MVDAVKGPINPIPIEPGPSGGGGGGGPPTPGTDYEMLLYRMLFPYYTPGAQVGTHDYFTLQSANVLFKVNTYQRLYGNPQSQPKPVLRCRVVNLSTDVLTVSEGQPGKQPSNSLAYQATELNPTSVTNGSGQPVDFFNVDMDNIWIQGPSGTDAYVVVWYVANSAVTIP